MTSQDDEPLISTDVDKLIKTIADTGKITLKELQHRCGMDKRSVEKWVRVLEDEGYISMQYKLGATHILWKGEMTEQKEEDSDNISDPILSEQLSSEESETQEPLNEQNENELDEMAQEKEAVEVSSPVKDIKDIRALKTSILTKLEDNSGEMVPRDVGTRKDEEEDIGAKHDEEENTFSLKHEGKMSISPETRELLASYIQEINKEKEKIGELKKSREKLYREKFAALQGKMEADIASLTELIIEKQSRITQLREHFLELPDKVDALEKMQEKAAKLKQESKSAIEEIRSKANAVLSDLEGTRNEVNQKIENIDNTVRKNEDRLLHLERVGQSVDRRISETKTKITDANAQIEEIATLIGQFKDQLVQSQSAKEDLGEEASEIRDTISEQSAELRTLKEDISKMAKIEDHIREYINNYQDKVREIEAYVEKSEDEMAELREAAESHYLWKYLSELENMTEAYEGELDEALSKEKEIERRITESRNRIMELIKTSHSTIKKLKSETSKGRQFDLMKAEILEKNQRLRTIVDQNPDEIEGDHEDLSGAEAQTSGKLFFSKGKKEKEIKKGKK